MSSTIILIILILILTILEVTALTFLEKFHFDKNYTFFVIGILLYVAISIVLVYTFNFNGVGIINAIWSGMSIILALIIQYYVFKIPISSNEIIAIILIILALILILNH